MISQHETFLYHEESETEIIYYTAYSKRMPETTTTTMMTMKSVFESWVVLGIVSAYFLYLAAPLSFAHPMQMPHLPQPCYGSGHFCLTCKYKLHIFIMT
jgi:hypothetical protein